MNPTIRDVIKRRVRWISLIAVAGWLLFPLSMSQVQKGHPPPPLFFVGMLLFVGAILAIQFVVRCPRCSAPLGQIALTIAFGWLRRRVNFCPYCGVSLDEPVPHKAIE